MSMRAAALPSLHHEGSFFATPLQKVKSRTEALDLTTPGGRAMAGMLAVFAEFEREILRDRVRSGIAQARQSGKPHGRPATARRHAAEARSLLQQGISKRRIAKILGIGRTSVRRIVH